GPADVDVAFFYDFFTPLVIMALEDYGFAPAGEGGAFVERGGLAWPDGRLVSNTNGGQLSEAFIHGVNNTAEAVRQIRGPSPARGAPDDPAGRLARRRGGPPARTSAPAPPRRPPRPGPRPPSRGGRVAMRCAPAPAPPGVVSATIPARPVPPVCRATSRGSERA